MNADELREQIADLLNDEVGVEAVIQGKRIVVTDESDVTVILVTAATREHLRRELMSRRNEAEPA